MPRSKKNQTTLVADLIDAVPHPDRSSKPTKVPLTTTIRYTCPHCLEGTRPQFPLVLVDEYQDLNPVNHQLLSQAC